MIGSQEPTYSGRSVWTFRLHAASKPLILPGVRSYRTHVVAKQLARSITSMRNFSFPKGINGWYRYSEFFLMNVMDNVCSKFGLRVLKDGLSTRRPGFLRFLFFLLLLGLVGGTAAANPTDQNPPANALAPGLLFAIADFDGDLRPDLASVQAGPNNSGTTDYRIQLQLSASGRQSIGVAAPTGGLLIEARDVNGDRAIDLVLVTAWFRKPVAIFLNDGHGRFSRAEPAAFPAAFNAFAPQWSSTSSRAMDAIGVPPRSRAGLCLQAEVLRPPIGQRADAIAVSNSGFPLSSLVISHAGRAPPWEVHHS